MIESVNNEKIVYFKKLRDSKYIKQEKKYIVEGEHLVEEAYKAGILESIISTYDTSYDVKHTLVSKKCLEKISLLKSVPDIMGVVTLKENKEIIGNKIILLDDVQDPGNVGTIIRSALSFNVSTVVFSNNSVNIFNDKLIRSSEGTIFNMNIVTMSLFEAIEKIHEKGIKVYYADMNAEVEADDLKVSEYALILGSEGQGISESVKELSDSSIKIEMNKNCESLNVAVSGAIIMYKLRR